MNYVAACSSGLVLTAGTSRGNTAVVTASAAPGRIHPGWCGDLLVHFKHSGLLELSSFFPEQIMTFTEFVLDPRCDL